MPTTRERSQKDFPKPCSIVSWADRVAECSTASLAVWRVRHSNRHRVPRIVQIIDIRADFQAQRGAAILEREAGSDFGITTRTLGPTGDWRNGASAFVALRSARANIDFIHAWGIAALTAGAVALPHKILVTITDFPTRRQLGWLRAVMAYRAVHVVCPTATSHRKCIEAGVAVDHCHLIRPGVEFAKVRRRRDAALRTALGFSDTDRVLLAPGESTAAAGHRESVWAASVLAALDPRYRLLIWGRGSRVEAVSRFARGLHGASLLSIAERQLARRVEFEELLPAADIVLITARGPVATLPISICMAAALPIVSTVTYSVSELLEDRHTALFARGTASRQAARRVLDLEADSNLQWSISDMARTEAFEYFSLTRFVSQYRAVYAQLAGGQRVEVPAEQAGAGLRFHGRA